MQWNNNNSHFLNHKFPNRFGCWIVRNEIKIKNNNKKNRCPIIFPIKTVFIVVCFSFLLFHFFLFIKLTWEQYKVGTMGRIWAIKEAIITCTVSFLFITAAGVIYHVVETFFFVAVLRNVLMFLFGAHSKITSKKGQQKTKLQ